jgi:hypothetical protein
VTKERGQFLADAQAQFGLNYTELVETAMQKSREAAVGALGWTEDSGDED